MNFSTSLVTPGLPIIYLGRCQVSVTLNCIGSARDSAIYYIVNGRPSPVLFCEKEAMPPTLYYFVFLISAKAHLVYASVEFLIYLFQQAINTALKYLQIFQYRIYNFKIFANISI